MEPEKRCVKLIENFVSWQGEGPDSGKRMIILRFKYCNLSCPWCDTRVKMRISTEAKFPISDIQQNIYENKCGIMITGGEPTYDKHFDDTVILLNNLHYPHANVETNGYNLISLIKKIDPEKPVKYIYSPKVFVRQDLQKAMENIVSLFTNENFSDRVFLKIVYDGSELVRDLFIEIDNFFSEYFEDEPFMNSKKVWVMPEGTTRDELIANSGRVFDLCEEFNFNFSSRDHIIYGFI